MYRGTTPTIKFQIKTLLDLSELSQVFVIFKSATKLVLLKEDRCEIDKVNKTVKVVLTQDETLQFYKGFVKTQIQIIMNDGSVYISSIKEISVNDSLYPVYVKPPETEAPEEPSKPEEGNPGNEEDQKNG